MAHGFELAMLGKLAFDGFANVEAHDTMAVVSGGHVPENLWW
jgi:hypothetical protein